jgi:hypothetical protein
MAETLFAYSSFNKWCVYEITKRSGDGPCLAPAMTMLVLGVQSGQMHPFRARLPSISAGRISAVNEGIVRLVTDVRRGTALASTPHTKEALFDRI